jgi:hypothetical protein
VIIKVSKALIRARKACLKIRKAFKVLKHRATPQQNGRHAEVVKLRRWLGSAQLTGQLNLLFARSLGGR